MARLKCKHLASRYFSLHGGNVSVYDAVYRTCADCDETLSLGKANDTPEALVELRAAEIAADGGVRCIKRWGELDGWVMRSCVPIAGADLSKKTPSKPGELAGYLAAVIASHDAAGRVG